jgi:hypothetical protein
MSFPWARPRHELLLLVLVGISALAVVQPLNVQDESRLCTSRALLHGRLTIDDCIGSAIDRSSYGGHLYTDKAPGISLLSTPAVAAVRLPPPARWPGYGYARLWLVRLTVSGLSFLLCAFLVGRVSEGIAPGFGGAALVTFALGTLMSAFGATSFSHVPAACLGFAAFLLAWARRPAAAGLAVGAAILVEYQLALVAAAVGVYVLLTGARPLLRYAAGVVPGALLLGAYDWAAFGSPFHVSYDYVANRYAAEQASGFFGIGLPRTHSIHEVFVGDRGLLVVSPVLAAAAAGLVLLARRYRVEAIVAAAVVVLFLVVNCGYFLPYGGYSPGPRYFVPALPFLALGLAPAFARLTVVTAALAAASVVASTAVLVSWTNASGPYRETVWGEIARVIPQRGSSHLADWLGRNALEWIRPGAIWSATTLGAIAALALGIALRSARA